MELLPGEPVELPLPPCLCKVQTRTKTEFTDQEMALVLPTLRQAVAGEEDVSTFQPAVGLAIKVVAKGR